MVNLSELDRRYQEMIACFEAIAQTKRELKRRTQLNWIAPRLDLPRAETRTLFKLWLLRRYREAAPMHSHPLPACHRISIA
jgi:hypothetical protein